MVIGEPVYTINSYGPNRIQGVRVGQEEARRIFKRAPSDAFIVEHNVDSVLHRV